MKPAVEWLSEVGEAVMFSAFVGEHDAPGSAVEKIIKRIQIDAIGEHTMTTQFEQEFLATMNRIEKSFQTNLSDGIFEEGTAMIANAINNLADAHREMAATQLQLVAAITHLKLGD